MTVLLASEERSLISVGVNNFVLLFVVGSPPSSDEGTISVIVTHWGAPSSAGFVSDQPSVVIALLYSSSLKTFFSVPPL